MRGNSCSLGGLGRCKFTQVITQVARAKQALQQDKAQKQAVATKSSRTAKWQPVALMHFATDFG